MNNKFAISTVNGQSEPCVHIVSTDADNIDNIIASQYPEGTTYIAITDEALPSDRTFRSAWVFNNGVVNEDLARSKTIAHKERRIKRAEEFQPHDDLISKQIPGADNDAAEAARAAIRTKYETMQTDIDACTDTAAIKTILNPS